MYANEALLLSLSLLFSGLIAYLASLLPKKLRVLSLVSLLVTPSIGVWLLFQPEYPTLTKIVGITIVIVSSINALRVYFSNYSDSYIRRQTFRTSIGVSLATLLWLASNLLVISLDFEYYAIIYGYIVLLLSLAAFHRIYSTLFINQLRASEKDVTKSPTVTLAIPARNEDAVLEASLHQHLKSTYPKLEIIVLDDCSHDSTAEIIKSFAHQGVRFIGGDDTKPGWLGKNSAYQQLFEAATGEIILFCGVDLRLSPEAISELVARYRQGNYQMLSVLPHYEPAAPTNKIWEIVQQTGRYGWHLGLSGLFSRTPSVVGSCWLIDSKRLKKLGGFKSVKKMTEPERYFARQLEATNDYGFTASSRLLADVTSTKRAESQFLHLLRIAYPLQSRSLNANIFGILAVVFTVLVPYTFLIVALLGEADLLASQILAIAGGVLVVSYTIIFYYTSAGFAWLAPFVLPIITIQTMVVMVWSMLKYEFSDIEWKGRNVCIPALEFEFKRPKKSRFRRRRRRRN